MAKKKGKKEPKEVPQSDVNDAAVEEARAIKEAYEEKKRNERMAELESENEKLKKELEITKEEHSKQESKQKEVIWYLNREMQTKDDEIASLKERVTRHKKSKEDTEEHYKQKLEEQEVQFTRTSMENEAGLQDLKVKYVELECFIEQKVN